MEKYIENNLKQGEFVEYTAKVSNWIFFIPTIIAITFAPATAGLSLIILIYPIAIIISTEMATTNERIIGRTGFISRNSFELRYEKIESIKLSQGIFGRIFNFGKLTINGAGVTKSEFKFISEPLKFRKYISHKL